MNTNNSEKERLQNNLMQAVRNCPKLKVGSRLLDSSFKIIPLQFLDFTEDKYEDGTHSYRMGASIKITYDKGEEILKIEIPCDIHFDARINGTDVDIEYGMIIAEGNILPLNWKL